MYQEKFMKEAVELAAQCLKTGKGGPFGTVVVKNDVIIGRGSNAVTATNDPTAHAEVMAIRDACRNLNAFQLTDCEIYTSCEPCPMCLGAIYWARPRVIYYATSKEDAAIAGFDDSYIYEELPLKPDQRQIPAEFHQSHDAKEVFIHWVAWSDKVKY